LIGNSFVRMKESIESARDSKALTLVFWGPFGIASQKAGGPAHGINNKKWKRAANTIGNVNQGGKGEGTPHASKFRMGVVALLGGALIVRQGETCLVIFADARIVSHSFLPDFVKWVFPGRGPTFGSCAASLARQARWT